MALPLLLAGVLCTSRLAGVKAQSTLAVCSEDYAWMTNSKGQSPCLVAAYLYVLCTGPAYAQLPALDSNLTSYYAPSDPDDLPCGCNDVMYSLLQACAACQGGEILTTSDYILGSNCTALAATYLNPIPPGTAVPQWAYQDVGETGIFDVVQAELTGDTPESTAAPTVTSTTVTFTSSTSTTTSSSSSPTSSAASSSSSASPTAGAGADSGNGSHKSSNVGPIVGGVVGGVLGFILLGSSIFYMLRRQRNLDRKAQAQAAAERPMSTVTDDGPQPSLKPMSMMSVPSVIYDPDDPRTFPSAIDPSAFGSRAASPAPSVPPASVAGHMHSFSALQNYTPGYNGSEHGYGYAASTYNRTPEV